MTPRAPAVRVDGRDLLRDHDDLYGRITARDRSARIRAMRVENSRGDFFTMHAGAVATRDARGRVAVFWAPVDAGLAPNVVRDAISEIRDDPA